MDAQTVMMIAAVVVIGALILAAWAYYVQRRRDDLRARFGPEYDRTVESAGRAARADAILTKRAERVDRFKLRPLTAVQAEGFVREWRRIQAGFVDNPAGAD